MNQLLKGRSVGIGLITAVTAVLLIQTQGVSSDNENTSGETRQIAAHKEFYGDAQPIVKVRPDYPKRALQRGIEGYVTLQFTVTEKGTVKDPVVVESEPAGIFDRSATQAALKFRYRPKVVDGKPIQVEGVKNKIVYRIENGQDEPDIGSLDDYLPVVKVSPEYPPRAVARGIEGSVILKFTVTEKGTVKDPVVVESDPAGIFDRSATQAALKFRYRPRVVDGKPTQVEGVKHKIVFELED